MTKRPKYVGEPRLAQVMRRPKWIVALLLSLAVAAGSAGLAQWQMGSAIKLQETEIDSETVYPLTELTAPGTPVNDSSAGRMIETDMQLVPEDSLIVANRVNGDELGYWLVGHATNTDEDEHLAVALGWANSREAAEDAQTRVERDPDVAQAHTIVGRYMPSEGVEQPAAGEPDSHLTTLSTGQSINLWESRDGPA